MWENIWRKDKFLNGYRKQAPVRRMWLPCPPLTRKR